MFGSAGVRVQVFVENRGTPPSKLIGQFVHCLPGVNIQGDVVEPNATSMIRRLEMLFFGLNKNEVGISEPVAEPVLPLLV